MKASAFLRKKTGTTDAREALVILRNVLIDHCEVSVDAVVSVWIYHRQDARVVRALAARVPGESGVFFGGKKKRMSAGEFLKAGADWKEGGFMGRLTGLPDVLAGLNLLDEVFALGDARAEIEVSGIRWRGSGDTWEGSVGVIGTSVRGREYGMKFSSSHPNVSSKEEALAVWKSIKTATGFDFAGGERYFHDDAIKREPEPHVLEAIRICLSEAMADATEAFSPTLRDWREVPEAKDGMEGFLSRMSHWGEGKSKPIPFDRLLKLRMKEALSEFVHQKEDYRTESLRFTKKLTKSTEMTLIVNKIHAQGLGKTFDLHVGVDFPGADFRQQHLQRNVFELFRCEGSRPRWTYHTEGDLEKALAGMTAFLSEAVPLLELALVKWLGEIPRQIPECVTRRATLSAYEAYAEAESMSKRWREDAFLVAVSGDGIGLDGRAAGGNWRFEFGHPGGRDGCRVMIPATGRARWGVLSSEKNSWTPIPLAEWTDSTLAWAVAVPLMSDSTLDHGRIEERIDRDGFRNHEWFIVGKLANDGESRHVRLAAGSLELLEGPV